MELLQLRYFCDAAESENFSYTAKKYYVPTSSVSQSVKRLETELGCALFEHLGNKIVLADAGKRFYEKVKPALTLLEEARLELTEDGGGLRGEISLLVICNRRLASLAIERFRALYPHVNFVLLYSKEDAAACDIVIADSVPAGYYEQSLLVEEDILLALRQDHPAAGREKLTAGELFGEKFISMPAGHSLHAVTETICDRAGFIPNITIQTADPSFVRKYVELGLGIAFVPAYSWAGLFSEAVMLRKVGEYKRRTYVYLPRGRKVRPAVTEFLRVLHEVQARRG